MARMRDRLFAGFGALLFFASTAITIFAIMSSNSGSGDTAKTDQNTCQAGANEEKVSVPEIYKPTTPLAELESTDLEQGTGAAAKSGDCLVMKYYGTLATDGTKFDENFTTTTAFAFKLGTGQVIEGWDKGLVGMKEGGTRRLAIPAAQAYGEQSPSPSIPASSDLVFVVKLLRIQK
jgi:FKBP-type peptidyl-prolyl cis-trans isomerase